MLTDIQHKYCVFLLGGEEGGGEEEEEGVPLWPFHFDFIPSVEQLQSGGAVETL